jgi:CRISPR-associated protein Cas2
VLLIILEKVPKKWKGVLSRWLLEIRPGTFLGNPTQRVRDELWKKLTNRPATGYVLQLWSSRLPRGFDYRQYGESARMLEDFEGLALVTRHKPNRKTRMVKRRKGKLFREPAEAASDKNAPSGNETLGEPERNAPESTSPDA